MRIFCYRLAALLVVLILMGCAPAATTTPAASAASRATNSPRVTVTLPAASATPRASSTVARPAHSPTQTTAPRSSQTPVATLAPGEWQTLPVVPVMTDGARAIFAQGQKLGRDPRAFSKIGDCASTPGWFLADFDHGPKWYSLGKYSNLQDTIDYFAGSFERVSLAVKPGFTTASVLSPLWADHKACEKNESPLACELRVHNPAFALIMLGSNNTPRPERFEPEMRKILDEIIALGVVPVLATKADNLEGDHAINAAIARLAQEYDLPLWNWWRAVQDLPNAGLQGDAAHLTWASPHFDQPENMRAAWPWLNLTALQTLDALRRE